jgi:hypothetical protein
VGTDRIRWLPIDVIDDDLGRIASGTVERQQVSEEPIVGENC